MAYHPDIMEDIAPGQFALMTEMKRWVDLCCDGASPMAAFLWLRMAPRLRVLGEECEWLADNLQPVNFFPEPGVNDARGSYILMVEDNSHAKYDWENYMPHLRAALTASMFENIDTSEISIEIWDRDCNVWSDEDLAA